MECAHCKQCHVAADGTIPSLPGVISGACVQFMFGKTSLAQAISYTYAFRISLFI